MRIKEEKEEEAKRNIAKIKRVFIYALDRLKWRSFGLKSIYGNERHTFSAKNTSESRIQNDNMTFHLG